MHLQQDVQSDRTVRFHRVHSPDHGIDVGQHLGGRDVTSLLAQLTSRIGPKQPSSPYHQTLDAGGRHGLGSQQQSRQCLGIGQGIHPPVEPDQVGLGVRDVRGHVAIEGETANGQWIRQVDRVSTRSAIAPGQPSEIGFPDTFLTGLCTKARQIMKTG